VKPLSNHKDKLERRELRDMVMQLHETVASNNLLVLGEMAQINQSTIGELKKLESLVVGLMNAFQR
jgi:hypothetical protein